MPRCGSSRALKPPEAGERDHYAWRPARGSPGQERVAGPFRALVESAHEDTAGRWIEGTMTATGCPFVLCHGDPGGTPRPEDTSPVVVIHWSLGRPPRADLTTYQQLTDNGRLTLLQITGYIITVLQIDN